MGSKAYREMTDAEEDASAREYARSWQHRHGYRLWLEAERVLEMVRLLVAESDLDGCNAAHLTGPARRPASVDLDAARLLSKRLARYETYIRACEDYEAERERDLADPNYKSGLPKRGLVSTGKYEGTRPDSLKVGSADGAGRGGE